MSLTFGALGQVTPGVASLTDAYTVPSGKRATVEVVICNRSTATSVRVSLAPAGAADANGQYLVYDYALADNVPLTTSRFTMSETDVVRCYSASGNVTFNVNGVEENA